jgi:hypothetical protein
MLPTSPELTFHLHTARNAELREQARRQGLARAMVAPRRRSRAVAHIRVTGLLRTWRSA